MDEIHNNLYNRALERRNAMTYEATNLQEMEEIINNHPGFVKAMWCGDGECEDKIKDLTAVKSRCIPFEEEHLDDKCVCCGKEAKYHVICIVDYFHVSICFLF